jgi:3',5'-cyclic AMP phosphodiesterase CpdA
MKCLKCIVLICVGLAAIAFWADGQEQEPDALYFVQITDPHWGCGPSVESTLDVIEAIRALPLRFDFMVLTGDVFCDDVAQEIAQQGFNALYQVDAPVHILAGNHDYVGTNIKTYSHYVDDLNYALEHNGLLLLFVSSAHSDHNPEPAIKAWIMETAEAHPDKPILMFHHEPFREGEYSPYTAESLKPWKALLQELPVAAVFAGHLHRDALLWHGDVPEFVASCILPWDGRQPSFRVYEYTHGRVSYQTFYVSGND